MLDRRQFIKSLKNAALLTPLAALMPSHVFASMQGNGFVGTTNIESQYIFVKNFGALGDGVTDDTAAIQAAIDSADSTNTKNEVWFHPGRYLCNNLVNKNGVILRGFGSGTPAGSIFHPQLVYNGAAGGTLLTYEDPGSGTLWQQGIYHLQLTGNGVAGQLPAKILDFEGRIDFNFALDECAFGSCTGDAITLQKACTNLTITRSRWDLVEGWGVRVQGNSNTTQWLSIDQFTIDTGTASCLGLLYIEGETATAEHESHIHISNGSIEMNTALIGDRTWIKLGVNPSFGAKIQHFVGIDNLALSEGFGGGVSSLIRQTTSSIDQISVIGSNIRFVGGDDPSVIANTLTPGPKSSSHQAFFVFAPFGTGDGAPGKSHSFATFTTELKMRNGRISSTIPQFEDGDTTPSIKNGNVFKTATVGAAILFLGEPEEGQKITLIATNNTTTIAVSGVMKLTAAWNPTTNDTLELVYDGTNFLEIARSANP